MSAHQAERAAELIAREAALFIVQEASTDSLITVTRAESSSHGDQVKVFVTVFPTEKTRAALSFLERQREAFSDYLKERVRMRLPRIDFLIENSGGLGDLKKN